MKKLFLLVVIFSFSAFSQDYVRVDATIQLYTKTLRNAEDLSRFISRDFSTEEDKVRAIYSWLINNVSYKPSEYKMFNYTFAKYRERNKKEEITREKIIERTLQTGRAVCEGYAFVFEKLCQLQGIDNYLIRGDTKSHFNDIGRSFKKNHMWNAAKIDGEWYLFDTTWGAGKYDEKFIKEPTYFYYKIAPEQLIKNHYPEMVEDSFLTSPISFTEFKRLPLIISNELLPEAIISPKEGVLNSNSSMNEIFFELKTKAPKQIQYAYDIIKETVPFIENDGILTFTIPVQIGSHSLLIYFDDEPVLGYKIE